MPAHPIVPCWQRHAAGDLAVWTDNINRSRIDTCDAPRLAAWRCALIGLAWGWGGHSRPRCRRRQVRGGGLVFVLLILSPSRLRCAEDRIERQPEQFARPLVDCL